MDDSLYRAAQAARPRPREAVYRPRPARSHAGAVFLVLLSLAGAGAAYLALDGQFGAGPAVKSNSPTLVQSGAATPFKTPYSGAQTAPEPPPDRAIYARMTETAAPAAPKAAPVAAEPVKTETAKTEAPKADSPKATAQLKAAPPPAPGAFTVQLGAFSTEAAGRAAWTRAQAQAGAALAGLSPDISAAAEESRTLHRLRAGAFADRAKAEALCAALQAKTISCLVVRR